MLTRILHTYLESFTISQRPDSHDVTWILMGLSNWYRIRSIIARSRAHNNMICLLAPCSEYIDIQISQNARMLQVYTCQPQHFQSVWDILEQTGDPWEQALHCANKIGNKRQFFLEEYQGIKLPVTISRNFYPLKYICTKSEVVQWKPSNSWKL